MFENFGNTVYAVECHAPINGRPCAVTFDFRAKEGLEARQAKCPVCGALCEVRAVWEADEGGYHVSRDVIVQLAKDRQRVLDELHELRIRLYSK